MSNQIIVLGLGKEGLATLRFILSSATNNPFAKDSKLIAADKKALEQMEEIDRNFLLKNPQIELCLGDDYLQRLSEKKLGQNDFVIKSPGINPRQPELDKLKMEGVQFTSATNLFFALKKGRVVAVTGSKGKSTTSSLVYAVMKEAGMNVELVGNIGKPALEFLSEDATDKWFVFEMSSYQLEDFTGHPDLGLMVSFFPEHMDYHGSEEAYYRAKLRLATQVKEGGVLIYNQGSELLRNYVEEMRIELELKALQVIPYNNGQNSQVVEIDGHLGLELDGEVVLRDTDWEVKGRHNLENLLGVAEVARQLGIGWNKLVDAAKKFKPLEHRLELVGEFKGIKFYNDSFSTAPESTIAAIEALAKLGLETLITGGFDRGYTFEKLVDKLAELEIKNLILLPDTGNKIAKLIAEMPDYKPNIVMANNMPDCVSKAYQLTREGGLCLLSCASPSYNLFKNFVERGNQFKDEVRKGSKLN